MVQARDIFIFRPTEVRLSVFLSLIFQHFPTAIWTTLNDDQPVQVRVGASVTVFNNSLVIAGGSTTYLGYSYDVYKQGTHFEHHVADSLFRVPYELRGVWSE